MGGDERNDQYGDFSRTSSHLQHSKASIANVAHGAHVAHVAHTTIVMVFLCVASFLVIWDVALIANHVLKFPALSSIRNISYISHAWFAAIISAVVMARSAFHLTGEMEWKNVSSVYLFFLIAFAIIPKLF